jgi:hypothetical protein
MRKILISLTLFLAFSAQAFSSEEDYFGKYSSINNGIKVAFTLNENGISDLIIDSIKVDIKTLTYDYLAIYGSSQVFQINFDDDKKCSNVIKLFIVKSDGVFIITTGYYLQYKMSDNEKLTVVRKQALELAYKKI